MIKCQMKFLPLLIKWIRNNGHQLLLSCTKHILKKTISKIWKKNQKMQLLN